MPQTQFWQLTDNFIDGQTPYTGEEIARFHATAEQQTTGALDAIGVGVLPWPDDTSFQVTAGVGRQVRIEAGRLVARDSASGPCLLELPEFTVRNLPANSVRVLFASIRRSEDLSLDSRASRSPEFTVSENEVLDGAQPLARISTSAGAVTLVEDLRSFIGNETGDGLTVEQAQDMIAQFFVAGVGISFAYNDATNTFTLVNSAPLSAEQVQDIVAAMVAAGTNISSTYNDATGTLTLSAAGGSGGLTTEEVQDVVAALLVAGTDVSLSYNDASGTLTVTATGAGALTLGTGNDQAARGDHTHAALDSFDIPFFFDGLATGNNQRLFSMKVATPFRLLAGLPGAVFEAESAGDGSVVVLKKSLSATPAQSTQIGLIPYDVGARFPDAPDFQNDVDFAVGDKFFAILNVTAGDFGYVHHVFRAVRL